MLDVRILIDRSCIDFAVRIAARQRPVSDKYGRRSGIHFQPPLHGEIGVVDFPPVDLKVLEAVECTALPGRHAGLEGGAIILPDRSGGRLHVVRRDGGGVQFYCDIRLHYAKLASIQQVIVERYVGAECIIRGTGTIGRRDQLN